MSVKQTLYYVIILHMFLVCYGLAVERAIADVEGDAFLQRLSSIVATRIHY
jgi:hypothetical protein